MAGELRVAVRRFLTRLRAESAGHDLTPSKRAVLARLDAQGPSTIAALARAEAVTPQSMGATVAAVEEEGLVERNPNPRDGRHAVISLTETGRRMLAESRALRQEWLEHAIASRLSDDEVQALRDAVAVLNRLAGS